MRVSRCAYHARGCEQVWHDAREQVCVCVCSCDVMRANGCAYHVPALTWCKRAGVLVMCRLRVLYARERVCWSCVNKRAALTWCTWTGGLLIMCQRASSSVLIRCDARDIMRRRARSSDVTRARTGVRIVCQRVCNSAVVRVSRCACDVPTRAQLLLDGRLGLQVLVPVVKLTGLLRTMVALLTK